MTLCALSQSNEILITGYINCNILLKSRVRKQQNEELYSFSVTQKRCRMSNISIFALSDMTFTHEGNKTFTDRLVNFEKMVSLQRIATS